MKSGFILIKWEFDARELILVQVLSPRIQGPSIFVFCNGIFITFLVKSSVPENKPSKPVSLSQNHLSLISAGALARDVH